MLYMFGVVGVLCFFFGLLGVGGSTTAVGQIGSLIVVLMGAVFMVGARILTALAELAQGLKSRG